MDVSVLTALFGTPGPLPVEWPAVESWLGTRLPADYRTLASACGPLEIGAALWLHTPCEREGRFDYGTWVRQTHHLCRTAARHFRPSPGLLAWGATRASDRLFWDTWAADDPDRWPVVVFDREAAERGLDPWHGLGVPMAETLLEAVSTGIALPSGTRLGPLAPTARRPAFLAGARPWHPPRSAFGSVSRASRLGSQAPG
ncbi:hypothetical protein [Amycolatopsis magusensis]|uniref:SMI1/KNR4 family protein n=1 Tax=Amycolatopsis magusensis TaxID=882444 RepID=A0ABS4PYZ5_9PSEU|nr:hypothetical protein [Amycolatopsis magusensis]MBP2184654.1 hypothetical protein [Amycolatopsis magusensis]